MRIIGGQLRGRRFQPPDRIPARPTTDFAREGLFNALNNVWDFSGLRFLDLFAGTGGISYEVGSRGCTQITAVEQDARLSAFIRKQAEAFGLNIDVLQEDVFRFLERRPGPQWQPYSLVFAGPPYPLPELKNLAVLVPSSGWVEPGGWFVLEHNPEHRFDDNPYFLMQRKYGTTLFSIFEMPESPA
jgi:16S rRNA (guanine966-N2)-methyltransferase